MSMNGSGKTVSLVLGSGGARGLAHIGAIEWLTENGFDIRAISGSSMGALIGGVHAAGKLDVYTDWVTQLEKYDVIRYLDLSFGGRGLFKGERIIGVLREMIGDHDIEKLPVAFTAVATDIEHQKEVWLDRGPLFDAIRASIAVPTVFLPHEYHGRRLLDGGLLNPLPIAPTLRELTDITVAVNVYGRPARAGRRQLPAAPEPVERDESMKGRIAAFIDDLQHSITRRPDVEKPADDGLGFFDIVLKSLDTMQNALVRVKLATDYPDVLINVPRDACMAYEFYRARELIELGRLQTERAMKEYMGS